MSLCCTVVSFVPFDIREEKPGLHPHLYHIPPSDMIAPSLLLVETATHFVYLDEARGNLQVKNPPDVIARSIVDDYVTSQIGIEDGVGPALFWMPDEVKLSDFQHNQELQSLSMKHKLRQRRWFMNITKMADDDWRKYHQHTVVSDFQRRLAEILDLDPKEHEWMAPLSMLNETSKRCPFCSTDIPKEAVVCSVCHNVVDRRRKKEIEDEIEKALKEG